MEQRRAPSSPGKSEAVVVTGRAVQSAHALSCHTLGRSAWAQRLSLPAQHPPHRR